MISNEKVFPDNVFTVWSIALCLKDGLTLPSSVVSAIDDIVSSCEPYIENGFTFNFLIDE